MIHRVAVKDRRVCSVIPRAFVQGGKNSDTLEIMADPEWLKCDSILVELKKAGQETFRALYTDEPFYVPERFMDNPGEMYIGLIGYVGDEIRLTTTFMSVTVAAVVIPTGVDFDEGESGPEEDNPDLWAQLIDLCKTTAQNEPLREQAEEEREKTFAESIERCEAATKRAEQIASVQRGTGISTGEGLPSLGGIEGDLYIDYETGDLYEFEKTEG